MRGPNVKRRISEQTTFKGPSVIVQEGTGVLSRGGLVGIRRNQRVAGCL